MDPAGLALSPLLARQRAPAVTWSGTHYVLAWKESVTASAWGVKGVRVSSAGAVLDPAPLDIGASTFDLLPPAVASDSVTSLALWGEEVTVPLGTVRGARIGAAGNLPDPNGFVVAGLPTGQSGAAVAFDGTTFVAAWTDRRGGSTATVDVFAARVTAQAQVLDSTGFALAAATGAQSGPRLASTGSGTLVTWSDGRVDTNGDVYAARLAPNATAPAGPHVVLAGSPQPEQEIAAACASAGAHCLVAWRRYEAPPVGTRLRARLITNAAPVATAATVATSEDSPRALTLTGSDADGDPLTFSVTAQPQFGTLTGSGATRTYRPAPEFFGQDRVVFTANDGLSTSTPATVTIDVTPVNDAPRAMPQAVSTDEDTGAAVSLVATDADGDPLSWAIDTPPAHGRLEGTAPALTFVPAPDFAGTDSFTFTASDGRLTSAPATVTLAIAPVNDAPLALAATLSTEMNTPIALELAAMDVDGDRLTWTIQTPPADGTLTGTPPQLTWTPGPGFVGTDTLAFTATDGTLTSNLATVTLSVVAPASADAGAADAGGVTEDAGPLPMTGGGAGGGGGSAAGCGCSGSEWGAPGARLGLLLALKQARTRRRGDLRAGPGSP